MLCLDTLLTFSHLPLRLRRWCSLLSDLASLFTKDCLKSVHSAPIKDAQHLQSVPSTLFPTNLTRSQKLSCFDWHKNWDKTDEVCSRRVREKCILLVGTGKKKKPQIWFWYRIVFSLTPDSNVFNTNTSVVPIYRHQQTRNKRGIQLCIQFKSSYRKCLVREATGTWNTRILCSSLLLGLPADSQEIKNYGEDVESLMTVLESATGTLKRSAEAEESWLFRGQVA